MTDNCGRSPTEGGEIWTVIDDGPIHCVDSITIAGADGYDRVVVCGSHLGSLVGGEARGLGVRGLIANDAGIGKEHAGIAGLMTLDACGIPAAAVAASTARIGDGVDTFRNGLISAANLTAEGLGVHPGMVANQAATLMASRPRPALSIETDATTPPRETIIDPGPPAVIALDSAGWISERHSGVIVVTGSHGGLVQGRAIKAPVAGAIFNDAGIGKDGAGVGRLGVLDGEGIPAMTVDHMSARIGDALDTYHSGVISHVNEAASRLGVSPTMAVSSAIVRLQETKIERLQHER